MTLTTNRRSMIRPSLLRTAAVLLIGGFVAFRASPVFAEPVRIELYGEVTSTTLPPFGSIWPGDFILLKITVDALAPDEDGTAGSYRATAPGTFEFFLTDEDSNEPNYLNYLGGGDVLAISADAVTGDWVGDLSETTVPWPLFPVTVSLNGLGMTPDQILPDFANFVSGTEFFDANHVPIYGFTIDVDVLEVDIFPEATSVPALSNGALFSLSAILLGAGLLGTRSLRPPQTSRKALALRLPADFQGF